MPDKEGNRSGVNTQVAEAGVIDENEELLPRQHKQHNTESTGRDTCGVHFGPWPRVCHRRPFFC